MNNRLAPRRADPTPASARVVLANDSGDVDDKRRLSVDGQQVGTGVYLDGLVYYQDADCVAIVSVTRLGARADRLLTLVDLKEKKEQWTAQQKDLFPSMEIDESSKRILARVLRREKHQGETLA